MVEMAKLLKWEEAYIAKINGTSTIDLVDMLWKQEDFEKDFDELSGRGVWQARVVAMALKLRIPFNR